MNDDERIRKAIEAALTHDVRVNLPQSDLEISCEAGEITLSGSVSSIAGKRLALHLAQRVPGVRKVRDLVEVAIAQEMGDKEITQHVRHAFLQERNIEEDRIEIQTDQRGHVLLRGSIHSLIQYRLCEVLSWWVPGVRNVHNLLVISPAEEDNDEELKDNLLTILEKDSLVDPKHFLVEVKNRRVTLRGRADSDSERDSAEQDCWYTPGVLEVENRLEVG